MLSALLDCQMADRVLRSGALVTPLQPQMARLDSLPGVDETAARVLRAETGRELSRCRAEARLASWAGV